MVLHFVISVDKDHPHKFQEKVTVCIINSPFMYK